MAIRVSPTRPTTVTASTIKKAKEDEAKKIQELLGMGASAARSIEQGLGKWLMERRGFRPGAVHMKGGMVEALKNLSLEEATGLRQHLDSGNWSRTSMRTETYDDVEPSLGWSGGRDSRTNTRNPYTSSRDRQERVQSVRNSYQGRDMGAKTIVTRSREIPVTHVEPYIMEHAGGAYSNILDAHIATLEAGKVSQAAELQARSLEARTLQQAAAALSSARGSRSRGILGLLGRRSTPNVSFDSVIEQLNSRPLRAPSQTQITADPSAAGSGGGSRGAAGKTSKTSSLGGLLGIGALDEKKKSGVNTPG